MTSRAEELGFDRETRALLAHLYCIVLGHDVLREDTESEAWADRVEFAEPLGAILASSDMSGVAAWNYLAETILNGATKDAFRALTTAISTLEGPLPVAIDGPLLDEVRTKMRGATVDAAHLGFDREARALLAHLYYQKGESVLTEHEPAAVWQSEAVRTQWMGPRRTALAIKGLTGAPAWNHLARTILGSNALEAAMALDTAVATMGMAQVRNGHELDRVRVKLRSYGRDPSATMGATPVPRSDNLAVDRRCAHVWLDDIAYPVETTAEMAEAIVLFTKLGRRAPIWYGNPYRGGAFVQTRLDLFNAGPILACVVGPGVSSLGHPSERPREEIDDTHVEPIAMARKRWRDLPESERGLKSVWLRDVALWRRVEG